MNQCICADQQSRLDAAICVHQHQLSRSAHCRGVYERNAEDTGSMYGAIKDSRVNASSCKCKQTLDQAGKGN